MNDGKTNDKHEVSDTENDLQDSGDDSCKAVVPLLNKAHENFTEVMICSITLIMNTFIYGIRPALSTKY
jgi:hypothetical protein